jgi:hypothetical protein
MIPALSKKIKTNTQLGKIWSHDHDLSDKYALNDICGIFSEEFWSQVSFWRNFLSALFNPWSCL